MRSQTPSVSIQEAARNRPPQIEMSDLHSGSSHQRTSPLRILNC